MERYVYIAGADPGADRSLVEFAIATLLADCVGAVRLYRPLAHDPKQPDAVARAADETAHHGRVRAAAGLAYRDAVRVQAGSGREALLAALVDRGLDLEYDNEVVLACGIDTAAADLPDATDLDARIAAELNAATVLVHDGHGRDVGELEAQAHNRIRAYRARRCDVVAVICTGTTPGVRESLTARIGVPVHALPEAPLPPAAGPERERAALALFTATVDTAALTAALTAPRPKRLTPMRFLRRMLDTARRHDCRLVLPEATDERVLRAADFLHRRTGTGVILLGDFARIRSAIVTLGLDLDTSRDDVRVIDPLTSPLRGELAQHYLVSREVHGHHLGLWEATDLLADPNYFGAMMVERGYADGMVSGAAHSTVDTLIPAFRTVGLAPGAALASSVLFLCLPERVLVFADCAVNRDPDAGQLADIAIASAATAEHFGLPARVAMISYSTGDSDRGIDVDKVRRATEIVGQRHPDLLITGPIQYDAAVDPDIAAVKAPDSPVAGAATVLVFPDLDTGNAVYKAVREATGAVTVGPVLQGLHRPINDLSRGATVRDIAATMAATAVQATNSSRPHDSAERTGAGKVNRCSEPSGILPSR
ncbi:phosphate acetyltransferase [Nocardia sp. NPDC050406]|uniref:phosphate acetyltransferase n=1 Tax=Nocardia sp. NPDC050406 TaxID=3364318 RepID=UPI0037874208